MSTCNVNNYECADAGLLLPLVNEYTWSIGARAFIYIVGLLWSFMGVSIIADMFMESIEMITSKKQKVQVADPNSDTGYTDIEILMWNGTVANLTLMALGSSAPEILLAIIEIVGNNFKAGALGPGTIVGSAAFNLMCITGICILSVPSPETKKLELIKVFAVTCIFSIFAYIWLIIILIVVTPDYVDLWEAFLTFLMFPAMVLLSYIADKDFCSRGPRKPSPEHLDLEAVIEGKELPETGIHANKRLILEFIKKLRHEKGYSEQDVATLASYVMEKEGSHSRGWYRRNAIREMTGSVKLTPNLDDRTRELLETMLLSEDTSGSRASFFSKPESMSKAIIEFAAPSAAVLEKDGRVKLCIMRHGKLNNRIVFKVETIDGTAESGSDYIEVKKSLVFDKDQTEQELEIEIVDDNIWEPDEVFFVRLSVEPDQVAEIGKRGVAQVVILNDDEPGTVEFDKPSFLFKESCGVARVPVKRVNGADGELKLNWKTKDISAVGGRDYEETEGELIFSHGEVEKHIEITINDDMEFEKDENFELFIDSVSKGAKIGHLSRTVVTIVNDDEFDGFVSRIANLTNANLDSLRLQRATWGKKFVEAMNVNGGDLEHASVFDYVMHFFTFGWKLIFAFVPPPTIWGGWLCFFVCLCFIGVLTAIIGDLASIFGCLIGLEDAVTAITLVALGTSLPDTFASRTAALNEKGADMAIGNVTGSNGVNVFLGLGFPWVMASIYWTVQGKSFEVSAGDLGFSVTVFTICAIFTVIVLMVRRYVSFFGGELGGPKVPKIISGVLLIFVWILYVLLSSLQTYKYIPGF
ncbi:sodium/calcium exchanger 2-like isoform X2 [Mercenaria mercenaria]|uniref:sodium/calcium exchanger 2-like isoform X2 n=1 Tax=Mercenaria mercenaria TaxID=6596 RepID=UPI00234F44EF|nr:sodium/calcium exchanger 2-like isoform X2 [Mercenaria mercenaria]